MLRHFTAFISLPQWSSSDEDFSRRNQQIRLPQKKSDKTEKDVKDLNSNVIEFLDENMYVRVRSTAQEWNANKL